MYKHNAKTSIYVENLYLEVSLKCTELFVPTYCNYRNFTHSYNVLFGYQFTKPLIKIGFNGLCRLPF